MRQLILLAVLLLWLAPATAGEPPEQVHLATNALGDGIIVQWGTAEATTLLCSSASDIEYGPDPDSLNLSASGSWEMYDWTTCVHTVELAGLAPNNTYHYRVGGDGEWSDVASFVTVPQGSRPVRIGAIADHGISSDAEATTQKMRAASLDLVIHAGDISYANDVGSGGVADQSLWDDYQNQIQPLAATVPHMYAPGNHEDEAYYEFDAYETRFYTSGSNPFWYSFSFEGIHFISLSSEHDYGPGSQQYNWLESELQEVDRQATPWLVVFAHRPMYSSNSAHGSEVDFRDAMEELLYDYGVDLAVWGHDHSYERSYPVFQEEPLSNSTSNATEPYRNPGAPIHVVVGTGGRSLYDEFEEPQPAWSAYREASYGYSVFEVTPQGELHFSFIRNSDSTVADQFWISKAPSPGPGSGDGNGDNTTDPDGNASDSKAGWQQKLEELPGPGLPVALSAMAIAARRRRRLLEPVAGQQEIGDAFGQ